MDPIDNSYLASVSFGFKCPICLANVQQDMIVSAFDMFSHFQIVRCPNNHKFYIEKSLYTLTPSFEENVEKAINSTEQTLERERSQISEEFYEKLTIQLDTVKKAIEPILNVFERGVGKDAIERTLLFQVWEKSFRSEKRPPYSLRE